MLLPIRDVTLPSDEASLYVESAQLLTYLNVILASTLVYDFRTPSVLILRCFPLLTFSQSALLTKRYVDENLQYILVVTVHDLQVTYFWESGLVDTGVEIY